jgi:hypothetical protein
MFDYQQSSLGRPFNPTKMQTMKTVHYFLQNLRKGKDKGTVHPKTGHEGIEGRRAIALLFL